MLKLRCKNNKHNEVWLVEPKVTIGRASSNDVIIEDAEADQQHAEILVKHEHLTLVNLSSKPLRVNNRLVKDRAELKVDDQVFIGKARFAVIDPKVEARPPPLESTGWALKANHAALGNRVYPINTETVIGRSRECDISLAAAHLSRRHVKLFVQEGLLYLRDLGSANGTYLNGERVTEARVRRGDELRFDTLSFGVIGPPSEDLDKTTIRTVAAVTGTAPVRPVASASFSSSSRSVAAQRQASYSDARPRRKAGAQEAVAADRQAAAVEAASAGNGRDKGLLRWGAILLLGLGLALGLAWQQGLLGI